MMLDVSSFSPIMFAIGPFVIRWYAIAYILGFVLGWKYCVELIKNSKKRPDAKDLDDLITWLVLGVILGGRLGYTLFYNASFYLTNPIEILKVWEGGMSFHGGVIGVIVATYIFTKKNNIKFLRVTDLICVAAPIGLFFGRVANFINNELWGKQTNGNWGVIFRDGEYLPRHPSQLYEAFLEGCILFIILALIYRKKSSSPGFASGMFLILYGIFRIIVELFREPDVQIGYLLEFITMGQVLSIPMIAVGIFLIIKKK